MRALLIAILTAASAAIVGSAARAQAPAPRVIEINAERFEFWPSEITIVEGEPVVFHIRSDDTLHGFRIAGTGTNVLVPKRGKGMVTVTPGPLAAGRYTFECSRLCGAGHNFMRGVLVVRPARQSMHGEREAPADRRQSVHDRHEAPHGRSGAPHDRRLSLRDEHHPPHQQHHGRHDERAASAASPHSPAAVRQP